MPFAAVRRADDLLVWPKRRTDGNQSPLIWTKPQFEAGAEHSPGQGYAAANSGMFQATDQEAGSIPETQWNESRAPLPILWPQPSIAFGPPHEISSQDPGHRDLASWNTTSGPPKLKALREDRQTAALYAEPFKAIGEGVVRLDFGSASTQAHLPGIAGHSLKLPWSPRLQPQQEESRARLVTAVSGQPRREVAGGFPRVESAVAGAPIARPAWPAGPRPIASPETSTSGRNLEQPIVTVTQAQTADVNSVPATQTAIERLIERTRQPVPVPGLEIRVMQPSEREAREQHRRKDARERDVVKTTTAPPPPAPQLDINAVADKVYQTLVRRQRFERERKGIY